MESNEDHPLYRRNSKKVAHMLQQILQRGEMQVQPHRIHEFLHRLHRRQANK
jgi:NAD-dependent SIR2 family protein deacetylase